MIPLGYVRDQAGDSNEYESKLPMMAHTDTLFGHFVSPPQTEFVTNYEHAIYKQRQRSASETARDRAAQRLQEKAIRQKMQDLQPNYLQQLISDQWINLYTSTIRDCASQ